MAVEEIIVTTRKRDENLQTVPIAVLAITGEQIQQRGINDLQKVIQQTSSLILDQGFAPQDQRIVIRGLSPTRGRQNAAVLQDGIDVSSEAIATAGGSLLINPRLFDLERVEVVKGPQVALYGRSAFNGAINYITRKPGDTFLARVGTDVGSDGQLQFSGGISGPVTSTLSAGVDAMTWSTDGYYTNWRTGDEMGETDGTSLSGTAVWKPTDTLSLIARVENLNDSFGVTPYAVMAFNTTFDVPIEARTPFDPDGPGGPLPPFPPLTTATTVPGVSGPAPSGLTSSPSEDPRTCAASGQPGCSDYPGSDRNITRTTLTADWNLGPVTLTSLSHYADASTDQVEGAEDVSANLSPVAGEFWLEQDTKLYSQELRFTSNGDGPVSWVAGGLYWHEDVDAEDGSFNCLNYTGGFVGGPPTFLPPYLSVAAPCGPTISVILPGAPLDAPGDGLTPLNADDWQRDTKSYSLYGLVEWQFAEQWRAAFEGRMVWEDLTVRGPDLDNGIYDPSGNFPCAFAPPFTPCPQTGPGTFDIPPPLTQVATARGDSESDDFFAPKVTLTWTPDADKLFYLSWAESFKPAGISALLAGTGAFYNTACGGPSDPNCTDPIANFRFDQEKLDVYELGAKTNWLDRRLQVNGAVFYQDFKNKQVSSQVPGANGILSARILNAGAAEVYGAELQLSWLPIDQLALNLEYTWLDSEYTDFKSNTTGVGAIAYQGNCTMVSPTPTTRACQVSYDGNELEGAPPNSLVLNAQYQDRLVGTTDWFVASDANYRDERYSSQDNQLQFDSYWLFSFRAGLQNKTWDVIAYVDNAFDDDTVKTGFADGSLPTFWATNRFLNQGTVILPDPRTYGLRVNYRFGN
jgi:outer membrane receptor protein involved in Fe transport